MEAVRHIINSNLLNGIIPLPLTFQNKKVEIIIFPMEGQTVLPTFNKSEIDAMLKSSVTESLIGVLPERGLSLEVYRAERLRKYEPVD